MKAKVFTKKRLAVLLVAALALTAVGTALAVNSGPKKAKTAKSVCTSNYNGPFKAKTARYNPANVPIDLVSAWGAGLGQQLGADKGIIFLLNPAPAPPGVSADANISPVTVPKTTTPVQLCSLGFDRMLGTHCTGGAPRFDVETAGGSTWYFACSAGTHTPLGNGWERITFSDGDVQNNTGPAFPGFAAAPEINFIQLTDDEGGDLGNPNPDFVNPAAVVDNIKVNDYYIAHP